MKKKVREDRTDGCWKERKREEIQGEAGRGETEDRELRKTKEKEREEDKEIRAERIEVSIV